MKKLLKLVRLLKEYEEWKVEKYGRGNYIRLLDKDLGVIFAERFPDKELITEDESRAIIISKGYNFIKWLVDNDRIDRHNVKETDYGWEFNYYWTIPNSKRNKEIPVERLLMILSIQESPIEYLISILK